LLQTKLLFKNTVTKLEIAVVTLVYKVVPLLL